jgi:hypothetical protein
MHESLFIKLKDHSGKTIIHTMSAKKNHLQFFNYIKHLLTKPFIYTKINKMFDLYIVNTNFLTIYIFWSHLIPFKCSIYF